MAKAAMELEREEKVSDNGQGSPIKKAKDWVSLGVTALPLFGAVGTVFVWAYASLYVGNVEIKTGAPYRTIAVQVFNEKGSENEFHSPRFQLMPGDYLLRVTLDSQPPKNLHAVVKYKETAVVAYEDAVAPAQVMPAANPNEDLKEVASQSSEKSAGQEKTAKKHWWQVWRK